jgi:hypothetical protein
MHVHRGVIYAYFLPIGSKAGSRPPAQLILSRDGVGPAQGAPNLPKYWRATIATRRAVMIGNTMTSWNILLHHPFLSAKLSEPKVVPKYLKSRATFARS